MAHTPVPETFSDLHIRVGDAFSVESLSPQKRYPVRLIGFVEPQSLLVSAPRIHGKAFLLPEGQLLKVRLMADNIACGFQTRVLKACRSPYLYAHLAYPDKIEAVAVRHASRVELHLPVRIDEWQAGELHGQWPKAARIVDMSSGGARLHSREPIAAVSSALKLSFKVVIDRVERVEVVKAIVRNITEVGQSMEEAAYQYGVQFVDVSEESRVWISGYVYEQMLRQGERRV